MVKEHIDQSKRLFCITVAQSVAVATVPPLLFSSCSSSEYDAYALSTAHGKIQVYEHRDVMPLLDTVREALNPVYRAFTALYGEESQERIRSGCESDYTHGVNWCTEVRTSDEVKYILAERDRVLEGRGLLDAVEVGWYAPSSPADSVEWAGVRYPKGVFVARYKPRE
jgi:hypothetical protein